MEVYRLPLYQYKATQNDAQGHPGQETHKLHMECRKQKTRENNSRPWRFENLNKKFLQNTPEKKFFSNCRQCTHQNNGLQKIGRTLYRTKHFAAYYWHRFPRD